MATNAPYFEIDPTGLSNRNRKEDEVYTIGEVGKPIRAISLTMGCFFTKSVKIVDPVTDKILTPGLDFIFTEVYTSLSIIYKQEIAGTIIITNGETSSEVEISYNFLGSDFTQTNKTLASAINVDASRREISGLQWSVLNGITSFIPSDYSRQIGAGIGFETIVYGLERIRSSILYGDLNLDFSIGTYIDEFINAIDKVLRLKIDNEVLEMMAEFKAQFTKEKLGLGDVVNLPPVDPEKAKYAALRTYSFNEDDNGYITIKGISKFKEVLYNNLVNSDQTGLGKHYGVYGLPLLTALYSLRNGGGFIIDSLNTATIMGYDFNRIVYPNIASPDDTWSLTKLTNNPTGQGGTLWATNMTTGEVYVGQLRDDINSEDVLTWTKLYSEYDMEKALKALSDHVNNIDNPHFTNKHLIDLGNVENLPLADYEDLACRVPSDKYVTHKFFLGFMSTYMDGLPTIEDLKNVSCEDDGDAAARIINSIKLIFTPCGPCGPCCEPNLIPVIEATTTTHAPVDPGGVLTGWFCESGKRWDILTDGFGGTVTVEHVYGPEDPDEDLDGCVLKATSTTSTTTTREPLPVAYTLTPNKTAVVAGDMLSVVVKSFNLTQNVYVRMDIVGAGLTSEMFLAPHSRGPQFFTFNANVDTFTFYTQIADNSVLVNGLKFKLVLRNGYTDEFLEESDEVTINIPAP